jgi:hypothetical protein
MFPSRKTSAVGLGVLEGQSTVNPEDWGEASSFIAPLAD